MVDEGENEHENDGQLHSSEHAQEGGNIIEKENDRRFSTDEVGSSFVRNTDVIADALMQLVRSANDNNSCTSSHAQSIKRRKRLKSFVTGEQDTAAITGSASIECTDTTFKRPRKEESKVLRSLPTPKLHFSSSVPIVGINKTSDNWETDGALSFSASEFKLPKQASNESKIPGELGSISNAFYQDFRPIGAPPRLATVIVPQDPLPLSPRSSLQMPPNAGLTMSSAVITEQQNGCLIMHSYTILPNQNTNPRAQLLLMNGIQPFHR